MGSPELKPEISSTNDLNQQSSEPPPVPPKDKKPISRPAITMQTPLAEILAYRQIDSSVNSMTLSGVEVYMNGKVDLLAKVSSALDQGQNQGQGQGHEFWHTFVQEFGDAFLAKYGCRQIEKKLLDSLPSELRPAIYLSLLNINTVIDDHTYGSIVKQAKLAHFENLKVSDLSSDLQDELSQAYWYCLSGNSQTNVQAAGFQSTEVVAALARVLENTDNLSKAEALTILLKMRETLTYNIKSEFNYKGSRAIEDSARDQFIHITKQGINPIEFFNGFFERVLDDEAESALKSKVFDLVIFEGLDFLHRLACSALHDQKDYIMSLEGDDLNEFLYSQKLVGSIDIGTLRRSVDVEYPIIKHENEYSLMNANSVSGNDSEISNLQEAHHELKSKSENLEQQYSQLQKTHEEIHGQMSEFTGRLAQAREDKASLLERREILQQKYSQLTMQENLSNTIKANKDISMANHDLEQQIDMLKSKVETNTRLLK